MKVRLKKIFGKIRYFLLMIALGTALTLISRMLCPYHFGNDYGFPSLSLYPDDYLDVSAGDDGYLAVLDNTSGTYMLTYVNPETGDQTFFREDSSLFKGNGYANEVTDIAAGEDGMVYALVLSYDMSSDYIAKESVVSFSMTDYKGYSELFSISYKDQFVRIGSLSGLGYYDGKVSFTYVDYGKTVLYRYDTSTGITVASREYLSDENGTFTYLARSADDKYLIIRSDGNVYLTGFDEPLGESILKIDESLADFDRDRLIRDGAFLDGDLYVYDLGSSICSLTGGHLTAVLDTLDLLDEDYSQIMSIEAKDGVLLIGAAGGIITCTPGGEAQITDICQKTSASYVLLSILALIGEITACLGAVGVVMYLILRKKTILYKQLITVLPVIAVIILIIAYNLYSLNVRQQDEMNAANLVSISNLCLNELKGIDCSGLTVMNEDTGRACTDIKAVLKTLETDDELDSGYGYNLGIFAPEEKGGRYIPLVSTSYFTVPLTTHYTDYYFGENIVMPSDGEVNVQQVSSPLFSLSSYSELYTIGKIEGTGTDMYLLVIAENASIGYGRIETLKKSAWSVALIFAAVSALLTLNSMSVSRGINKASKAIKDIAAGNLSARASYKGKDELGEICGQVNVMAESLDNMFREKDRTEKFYYKFVPEKFRVLLDKKEFTDLKLGDAKSREITILFCDIRSFSINSEIMTAKENFEFINEIYGQAGPIVREHNGFIDKYIGDAIMALFDDPEDAIKCGIDMYRRVALSEDSQINIGIGIHSGMAMVGIVGEAERLSGTVISDAVNLSSRLESLTKQYKTAMLVSKDTIDRLPDASLYDLRYLGILQVAGVNEVKSVYEVLDCLPEDIRAERKSHSEDLREAVKNFHMGNRKEAAQILAGIDKDCDQEKDGVIRKYLDYISNMSDEDKGNVFRFTKK